MKKIAAEGSRAALTEEVKALKRDCLLTSQGGLDVYLVKADEVFHILLEIGRLREICFRGVGEGSGKERDLDEFDQYYLHLFVWDRRQECIAGAYRIGQTDSILEEFGSEGLYSSTLFQFEQAFIDYLDPSLEMGRSFVAQEYQRSFGALSILWKGIAQFVAKHPKYRKLFGPVSISNDYLPISKDLIVKFMREKRSNEWAQYVIPRSPYDASELGLEEISVKLESIEQVSAQISANEPDGKGLPVLLRQYLRLNAALLEFNQDADFANCLDALILVDLRNVPARMLAR